jgi:hypothetical protein
VIVLEAEVGEEQLGGANVHGPERRAHDAEDQLEVLARRAGAGGHGGLAPPFLPRAPTTAVAGIGPLHQRRQRLSSSSGAPRRGGELRRLRLTARPRPRWQQPARHLVPQHGEEALLPFHGRGDLFENNGILRGCSPGAMWPRNELGEGSVANLYSSVGLGLQKRWVRRAAGEWW